ncbi:MAG: response regulator [Magnetococcales bacterium]|nr:response regulator [Magnetococcales bacterium]
MSKILVVDDEPQNCLLMEAFLKRCPQKPVTKSCYAGAQAVALVGSWKPDAIFIDLHMPGMDGIDTIKAIRAAGFTGRIIIVTADHRSENARLGSKAGANGFLAKPVDGRSICKTLE